MSRSLRVRQGYINKVKLSLRLNGFPSQRALAEDVGFALATVSNFLTGKPVDYATFEELSRRLALDWQEISTFNLEGLSRSIDRDSETYDLAKPVSSAKPASSAKPSDLSHLGLSAQSLYPSGAVPIGSPFYLERTFLKNQIDQEISKPGALVRIKAPREMGKTSLLIRVLDSARRIGYRTVSLNLEQVDQAILHDLNQFLRWFCANTARQLQLEPRLDEYWDEDLGSKISCTSYFQDYLLKTLSTPLVLALDEMNCLFEHPQVAKDFLPLLRSWYEEAKTLPIWRKLRLMIVHSTEIYVPLNLTQSPFNVGLPIQLTPFSQEDVQQLAQCYELGWEDDKNAAQLMSVVGGHPALVHTAIYHLSRRELTLKHLLEMDPTVMGIYNHHLQRHWVILQDQPELANALSTVINAAKPISLACLEFYKLSSLGLIEQSGDGVVPSCKLYQFYFSHQAVNHHG